MKIGILNLFLVNNYGAVAQAYALEKAVDKLGYEAETIRYVQKISKKIYNKKCLNELGLTGYLLRVFNFELIMKRREKGFERFRAKHMNMSPNYNEGNISSIENRYDKIIVGSDIVWSTARGAFDPNLFLPFFCDKNKKAAYAASLGNNKIEERHENFFNDYVSRFGSISLREESARDTIESIVGREVPVMPDPVFLLKREDWEKVIVPVKQKQEKYIYVYQLRIDGELAKLVSDLSKKTGLKVIYSPFPIFKPIKCSTKPWISVDRWLGYIKNAEYVVTDSFHAVCFSLIFNKKFFVKVSAFGSRIENLFERYNLSDRMITDVESAPLSEEIDFSFVNEKLSRERVRGNRYLFSMLAGIEKFSEPIPCDSLECTGCGVCSQVCHKKAITMSEDKLGFAVPVVDKNLCVECMMCRKFCPALTAKERPGNKSIEVFAAKNSAESIRTSSTSGGVFIALSGVILDNGGVVYGVAFDEAMHVRHFRARTKEERDVFRGSKYVQSDMNKIYDAVLNDLKNDIQVMFSGTPCQCAAVKNYIEYNNFPTNNLVLVDIVCHGVSSPKVWEEYLRLLEEKCDCRVDEISFRSKEKGWHSMMMSAKSGDKDLSDFCNKQFSFLNIFHNDAGMRKSCRYCRYKDCSRVGDITLGDFWGIEKTNSKMDDNRGTSLIMINSAIGKEIMKKSNGLVAEKRSINEAIQPSLKRQGTLTPAAESFEKEIELNGITAAVEKYTVPSKMSVIKNRVLLPIMCKTGLLKIASKINSKG